MDIEEVILAEVPNVIPNQEVYVYVPTATYTTKGIASYDSLCFIVKDGKVTINESYAKTLFDKIHGILFVYRGTVNSYEDLPTENLSIGDTWNVVEAHGSYLPNSNYTWNGVDWDNLGGTFDLSGYYNKNEINGLLATYYTKDALNAILNNNYYSKTLIDSMFESYYTKTEIVTLFSSYYTKSEITTLFNGYYTKSQLYTKSEIDSLLSNIQKIIDELPSETNVYVDGSKVNDLSFTSDPQLQLDNLNGKIGSGSGTTSGITDISLSVEDGQSGGVVTTYPISVTATNATYTGNSTIASNNIATVTFKPNSGYELPTSLSVVNADYSYNSFTGLLTLSNARGNVTISLTAITAKTTFSISVNAVNCTYTSPSSIYKNGTATVTFSPKSGYDYSGSTNVTGASWRLASYAIVLSNPTKNVSINLICNKTAESADPERTLSVEVYYGEETPALYADITTGTLVSEFAYSFPESFDVSDYISYIIPGDGSYNCLFYRDSTGVYRKVPGSMELVANSDGSDTVYQFYVAQVIHLYDTTTNNTYQYWFIRGQTFGQWLDTVFEDDDPSKDGSTTTGDANNYILMYDAGLYVTTETKEYIGSEASIVAESIYTLTDEIPE